MKIFIACSTSFYNKIPPIKEFLEKNNHQVILPNGYGTEDNYGTSKESYEAFFKKMYYESQEKIKSIDAILALNYTKIKDDMKFPNYIGASTFLELYEAFMNNKNIYLMNDIPNNLLKDEIKGFAPIILNENLEIFKGEKNE